MLQILLDHLSDEAEKIHTRKRKVFDGLKFFESLQLRGPEVSDSAARLQQLESLSAKGRMPFAGLMEHVIICEICGFMVRRGYPLQGLINLFPQSSVRLQVFNNISVPVLDVGICSVEDMLENYFSQEQISGWVCDNCTTINALKAIGAGAAKCMEGLMPILKSLTEQGVISPSAARNYLPAPARAPLTWNSVAQVSFSKDLDIGKLLSSMPHGKIDKKVLEYARTLRKLDAEKKKYELYATNKFSEEFRPVRSLAAVTAHLLTHIPKGQRRKICPQSLFDGS